MRTQVRFLAPLQPAAAAPTWVPAWELPYVTPAALKKWKKKVYQDCLVHFGRLCVPTMCLGVWQALWLNTHAHTVPNMEEPEITMAETDIQTPLECQVLQQWHMNRPWSTEEINLGPGLGKTSWSDPWFVFQCISKCYLSYKRYSKLSGRRARSCLHHSRLGIKELV